MSDELNELIAEENQDMQEYIKIKKDFDWAGFKKQLDIRGDKIISKETGEIIENAHPDSDGDLGS